MNETITAVSLIALALGVLVFLIWALCWIVLSRWDRRPKDGPRCRHCGYDLRASAGDSCPECGKPFAPHGVWPKGLPNRGPAIHRIAIWLWLCMVGMILASHIYSHHVRTWWEYEQHDQAVAILSDPESGTYDLAIIALNGEGWRSKGRGIRPDSWTIVVLSAGVDVQALNADAESGLAKTHPISDLAHDYAKSPANQAALDREPVTPELLAGFHPLGLNAETDEQLLAEMQLLIDLANHLADETPLPREIPTNAEKLDRYPRSVELQAAFGKQLVFKNQNSQSVIEPLPLWPLWFVPGVGLVALVLGTILIRKRTYLKMAVDHIPGREQMTLSDPSLPT